MRKLVVTMNVDDPVLQPALYARYGIDSLQRYANKIGAKFRVITERAHPELLPLSERIQVREIAKDYDRILYCDADVIVTPHAPDIFEEVPASHVGVVPNNADADCSKAIPGRDGKENDPAARQQIREIQEMFHPVDWYGPYFNMGVVVFSRQHANVFKDDYLGYTGCHMDQAAYNYNIYDEGYKIHALGSRWNCFMNAGTRNRDCAYILHWAGSRNKVQARAESMRQKWEYYYGGNK